jgi:predicted ester cyclase
VSSEEEKNKSLARRFLKAQAKGDLDALDELMAPDFADRSLLPGQASDRESYKRSVVEMLAAFTNIGLTIEDQIAERDKVVTRYTGRNVHRGEFFGVTPTGEEADYSGIFIHRIAGGKVVEEWSESDPLSVIQPAFEREIRERERVDQELRVARSIQQASLPKEVPTLEGWQVAPYYQPAREVGGDFYDLFEFEEGRVGVVVGDATGKGMPAALVVSATSSMPRAVAQALGSSSPGELLAWANETLLARIPPNMFVTCFYAILDPKSGRLLYANAGHDLPYLNRGGDDDAEELRARGMPLGLMPGMSYEEGEVSLGEGNCVLFYSDGLVEAHDPEGEMFGFPRLRALVAQHVQERSLGDFLIEELYSFVGEDWEQEDDITLVTLQRCATLRSTAENPLPCSWMDRRIGPVLDRGEGSCLTWLLEGRLLKEKALRKLLLLLGLSMLGTMLLASVALAVTRHCDGRPCIGTRQADTLIERRGNGVSDGIYGRRGRDVLRAGRYTRDTDRLHGNRGRDRVSVLDGDTRDKALGGPGHDTCVIDDSREIGRGCEVFVVS